MFRPKNPTPPTNHRLPKLLQALTETDLQFVLSAAESRRGTTIELPHQRGGTVYMITARLLEGANEPVWTYFSGDDSRAEVVWQHPTGDLNLIFNLCSLDSSGDGYMTTTANSMPNKAAPSSHNGSLEMPAVPAPSPNISEARISAGGQGREATLKGELSNMQIPTLLQSISMSRMTGRLQLEHRGSQAAVYFEDGLPLHAYTAESIGDNAIVELITWEDGQFHFYPSEKTADRSIKRRVDGLLMEGVALLDQNKYVTEQGLRPQSYLLRKQERLSEAQFREALVQGAPVDMELQKRFYGQIDNSSTLLDILRRMPMVKNQWVPIMFNMLSCGLVTLSDSAPTIVQVAPATPKAPTFEIDRAAIQGVIRQLTRQETGVFNYPVFLYFLELEFSKCAALGMPLSLLVFEPRLRIGDVTQSLPTQYAKELMRRIETFKRPFDALGHFETFDFAMFLPNTQTRAAKVFALKLAEIFAGDPFIPQPMGQLNIFTGIAAAPEDTQDLQTLLGAAKDAKKRALETGNLVTVFRENPHGVG